MVTGQISESPLILLLRPQEHWNIVAAELKRVITLGRYMSVEGTRRSENVSEDLAELRQLATLCEEMTADALYVHYADKKKYRRASQFWASNDKTVNSYIKCMTDQRLLKAVMLADQLDIPILYAPTAKTPLHIENRLQLQALTRVKPVMSFSRHAEGISYRLTLRISEDDQCEHVVSPTEKGIVVLAYEPGIFLFGNQLLLLDEGFSGKLLLPFAKKEVVEIPTHMVDDYFRRFILRNVAKAEIHAEGFNIEDIDIEPLPCLHVNTSVDDRHVLMLRFHYDQTEYTPDSKSAGRVMLATDRAVSEREESEQASISESEQAVSVRFIRYLRNKEKEQQFIKLLKEMGLKLAADGIISFDTLPAMVDWLQQNSPRLRSQGFSVVQPSDKVYYIGPLSVEQSDTWRGDWLQTEVTVVLDDGRLRLPFRDLRDTILRGEQLYMLPTGERLVIPPEWLSRYEDLLVLGLPKGKGFQLHRSQVSAITSPTPPTSLSPHVPLVPHIPASSLGPPSPKTLKATFRPYQLTGYQWLWRNFENQTGCCLADEMGLGKTVQTIALLLKYKETAKRNRARKPQAGMLFSEKEMQGGIEAGRQLNQSLQYKTSLVVAPASVVHNWRNELKRFAPSLLVLTYTGSIGKRREKRLALMKWDVVVTTYRTLVNDIDYFVQEQFGIVVYDESQAFKTPTSKVHHAVCRLDALHRMALSGTPVENNLQELWSLMSVLNPNLLGSARHFRETFLSPIAHHLNEERTQVLRRLIAPYFLKRTKEEVLSDLPDRQDEVVICPMTEQQESQYAEQLSRARNAYMVEQASNVNILAAIQRLRSIANGEGKMKVLFERLEQLRGTRHKVLLFSEYVSMLEQVGSAMQRLGWSYDLLTGQTQQREQVIAHFQSTSDCQFFLISLKAGGVGLNLTAADYVFILDPWWNLAAEEQAIARSHRIGQRYPVFVYRFVSEGTLEQQILTLQEHKQNLIDAVMPFILK